MLNKSHKRSLRKVIRRYINVHIRKEDEKQRNIAGFFTFFLHLCVATYGYAYRNTIFFFHLKQTVECSVYLFEKMFHHGK